MGLNWTPSVQSPALGEALAQTPRPQPARAGLALDEGRLALLAQRVRAEYLEMPGLNVTRAQAQCLWGLDAVPCEQLLGHLVATGFLARTAHGTYVRAE